MNSFMLRIAGLAFTVAITVLGCARSTNGSISSPSGPSPAKQAPLHIPSENSMTPSDRHPYIQLSAQDVQKLVENMKKVQLGDSWNDVKVLLGKPTYNQMARRKKNDELIGRFVKYYVTMQDKDSANEKLDRRVLLQIDSRQ